MTGRELIIYILLNDLEDVDIFESSSTLPDALGLIEIEKVAAEMAVGIESIRALAMLGVVTSVAINGKEYILSRNN